MTYALCCDGLFKYKNYIAKTNGQNIAHLLENCSVHRIERRVLHHRYLRRFFVSYITNKTSKLELVDVGGITL